MGAPGTFQAVIEDMLQVLDAEDVIAYLDDVICFHSSFEEHLKGVERLLQTIKKSGFKLSGRKCQFATRSVKFNKMHFVQSDKGAVSPCFRIRRKEASS